ncbi:tRNA preQ1(34) S-adenosylmethionine ribosyltransferase-isomerase QueA [Candidatus Saccharibacteria bacterium]|nr:tRNA preQ1(34) S-adenosylmethionine ribosyltransferase-isomerase QueA [Candidatus Saccharibacteria bacterium]
MLVSDFNYDLPEDRIAKFPPKERGSTHLLVLDRKTGAVKDSYYKDLVDFLNPGDVLVLNDTRVIKSRLFCELPDGRKRELVVLEKHGSEPQRVMYRGKLRVGDQLTVRPEGIRRLASRGRAPAARGARPLGRELPKANGPAGRGPRVDSEVVVITGILGNGIAEVESNTSLSELAQLYGEVPLPPYLKRNANKNDEKRYQTIFAKEMGSAAAPTASLNMTEDLLEKLRKKGVKVRYLTLHVGLGTFLPIRTTNLEDHKMHSEWFHIPNETLRAIKAARKIIALGTTVARTLEYYAMTGKTEGEDDIFIYPGYEFKLVDALITNFHAPKSTVLMLASAFAGWDNLKNAYEHAKLKKYNFLSYGDSMLIC